MSIVPIIDLFTIIKADISQAIDELSNDSAAGEDEFPAVILKLCKEAMLEPLQSAYTLL